MRFEDLPVELLTKSMESQGYEYRGKKEGDGYVNYYYQTVDKKTIIYVTDNKAGNYWTVWFYPVVEETEAPAFGKFAAREMGRPLCIKTPTRF